MIISANINNINLSFKTSPKIFSPHSVDKGTLAMLGIAEFTQGDKVLDLGCGYGVVGIYAAKIIGSQNITMSDIDAKCIELSALNAKSNGVDSINIILSNGFDNIADKGYNAILSNPPYHADFKIPKHFIEKGFNRLQIGGKMYMVTKRKDWYKNKLSSVFGGVKLYEIEGYYVFCAEKRNSHYANRKK